MIETKSIDPVGLQMGDKDSWDSFVSTNYAELVSAAHANGIPPSDVEDIVQETLLNAYRAFTSGRVDIKGNLGAYTGRILRNQSINYHRKSKRQRHNSFEEIVAIEGEESFASADPNPDEVVVHNDLLHSLRGIPNTFLGPFLLHVEGHSYEQIASYMRVASGTIKSRISRGRGQAKEIIEASK